MANIELLLALNPESFPEALCLPCEQDAPVPAGCGTSPDKVVVGSHAVTPQLLCLQQ